MKKAPTSDVPEDNFFIRNIKFISIAAVALVLVVGIVMIARTGLASRRMKKAAREYEEIFKPYASLTTESTDEERREVLASLAEREGALSPKSFSYFRLNYYKADICRALGDAAGEREALSRIVASAGKSVYLLQPALYRYAVMHEDDGKALDAASYYERIWNDYGKESPFSEFALFALYRIHGENNAELSAKYGKLLKEHYPEGELSKLVPAEE